MRKIILPLLIIFISLLGVGHGYALFQDLVKASENKFYSGSFELQISHTDDNGDNIADLPMSYWSDNVANIWSTPLKWVPGDTVSSKVFIRNLGNIDAESVLLTLTNRKYYGVNHLDEVVNLIAAWYDRNGNGIQDPGEDILPDLKAKYDNNGGEFTLLDFYTGTDLVHSGVAYDLEPGTEVLPGVDTDDAIGGNAGHGKGLFLTWQYDPTADAKYQGAWVDVDLEFTATQGTNS